MWMIGAMMCDGRSFASCTILAEIRFDHLEAGVLERRVEVRLFEAIDWPSPRAGRRRASRCRR
jgi:hypothetical protein